MSQTILFNGTDNNKNQYAMSFHYDKYDSNSEGIYRLIFEAPGEAHFFELPKEDARAFAKEILKVLKETSNPQLKK
jgi:hypothetical protein